MRLVLLLLSVLLLIARTETIEGFLTDLECDYLVWDSDGTKIEDGVALDDVDLELEPYLHTTHCMYEIDRCRESGFTINQQVPGSSTKWIPTYRLDTAGNTLAVSLLEKTKRKDNWWVTVNGTVSGSASTSVPPTLLLAVESMVESSATNPFAAAPALSARLALVLLALASA